MADESDSTQTMQQPGTLTKDQSGRGSTTVITIFEMGIGSGTRRRGGPATVTSKTVSAFKITVNRVTKTTT